MIVVTGHVTWCRYIVHYTRRLPLTSCVRVLYRHSRIMESRGALSRCTLAALTLTCIHVFYLWLPPYTLMHYAKVVILSLQILPYYRVHSTILCITRDAVIIFLLPSHFRWSAQSVSKNWSTAKRNEEVGGTCVFAVIYFRLLFANIVSNDSLWGF